MVALEAEGADPELGSEIHYRERVENRATGPTAERRVWQNWQLRKALDWSVNSRDGDNAVGGLLLRPRHHVPGHPDAVLRFQI